MEITADMVKKLRIRTNAGMMDCKKALEESEGNFEKAMDYLRKKGLATAMKRAGRATTEGLIHSYIHPGAKLGVLVEVNCETDFVARSEKFHQFVNDIAMQIAASAPLSIKREDLAPEQVDREREIYRQQALESGKPEKVIDKIIEGKMNKFYSEVCLIEQPFVKDSDKSVADILNEAIGAIGENINIRRFVRYKLGEGSD